jgi:hypothetical protein
MRQLFPAITLMIIGILSAAAPTTKAQQVFANHAGDSLESPYIRNVTVSVDERNLILRFGGNLSLGRHAEALKKNTNDTFRYADTKLSITLDN